MDKPILTAKPNSTTTRARLPDGKEVPIHTVTEIQEVFPSSLSGGTELFDVASVSEKLDNGRESSLTSLEIEHIDSGRAMEHDSYDDLKDSDFIAALPAIREQVRGEKHVRLSEIFAESRARRQKIFAEYEARGNGPSPR